MYLIKEKGKNKETKNLLSNNKTEEWGAIEKRSYDTFLRPISNLISNDNQLKNKTDTLYKIISGGLPKKNMVLSNCIEKKITIEGDDCRYIEEGIFQVYNEEDKTLTLLQIYPATSDYSNGKYGFIDDNIGGSQSNNTLYNYVAYNSLSLSDLKLIIPIYKYKEGFKFYAKYDENDEVYKIIYEAENDVDLLLSDTTNKEYTFPSVSISDSSDEEV